MTTSHHSSAPVSTLPKFTLRIESSPRRPRHAGFRSVAGPRRNLGSPGHRAEQPGAIVANPDFQNILPRRQLQVLAKLEAPGHQLRENLRFDSHVIRFRHVVYQLPRRSKGLDYEVHAGGLPAVALGDKGERMRVHAIV